MGPSIASLLSALYDIETFDSVTNKRDAELTGLCRKYVLPYSKVLHRPARKKHGQQRGTNGSGILWIKRLRGF